MTSVADLKSRTQNMAPIDENVKLPAAIRAAAARSNAIHQQAYETPQEPNAEQPKVENAPAPAEARAEGQPTPTQPEAAPAPKAGTENPAPAPKADDWEHKYNSLRGRYDRQESTISGLNARIAHMEGLLARASAQPTPVQTPNPDLQFKPLITDKDREDFGADFLDVAQRAALEKVNPEIAALKAKLAQLEGTVGSVAQQTQQTTVMSVNALLDRDMPNWRAINRDPKFIAWTNLPDPLSGGIRINMLKEAHARGDGQRVMAFFKGFLGDEAATAPAPTPKPDTTNKVPLAEFAAPGRATAAAATTPPAGKETITRAQIAAFYSDVNKGKYRGNEAEKNRLEAMIFEAERDRRVI